MIYGRTPEYSLYLILAADNTVARESITFQDDLRAYLKGKRLLITGRTLGGWALPIPRRMLQNFVVLELGNCKVESRYGYRGCAFVSGDESSWLCDKNADDIVGRVLDVISGLINLGINPDLSLIGVSAGVDQIMTLASEFGHFSEPSKPRLAFLVPIAGAYHPTIFPLAAEVIREHGTHVLVHSHRDDECCPWEKLDDYWNKLEWYSRESRFGGVYIHLMKLRDRSLIDKRFHNITHFLCAQAEFWNEVNLSHSYETGQDFRHRCQVHQYGEAHRNVSDFVDHWQESINWYAKKEKTRF